MERAERRMHCMEVWGGNAPADSHVALSGLDVWVYSRPFGGGASGGDVYYLSSCATGRISRLLLADVSGHGEQVASTADSLRMLMQRYVNYLDQAQFVRRMNQTFAGVTAADGKFATAIVASFFATNNHVSLNNAGHPPPLHYDSRARHWRLVTSDSVDMSDMPLGLDEQSTYSQSEITLQDEDLVLAYSDALIDADDAEGNSLSPEALLALVGGMDVGDPQALLRGLLERIGRMSPENLQRDDVTVLMIRPTGKLKHLPLARKLTAPIRFAAETVRSLVRGEPIAWPEWSKATVGGMFCDAIGRPRNGCGCGQRRQAR